MKEAGPVDPRELEQELRAFLKETLPDYMVPAAIVYVDAFPLTPSGKVDRNTLSQIRPQAAGPDPGSVFRTPYRTPAEELLAGIWAEVLGREWVGPQDGFFELGGHSLLATQVVSRIRGAFGVELPLRALFEFPTVERLARQIEELRGEERGEGTPVPRLASVDRSVSGGRLPLSFAQERLWFLDRLIPGSPVYNIPQALRFTGALDLALLEAVLHALIARHESLRTTFHQDEETGQPYQAVGPVPERPLPLPVADLSGLPDPEAEARHQATAEALRPFDLERGPLVRWLLLRLGPDDHAVVFTMHHIISDGWSMGVLTGEVRALYQGLAAGEARPERRLPRLPVQYGDFAVWQRSWLQGEALESQLGYWRERLTGVPALRLPTDRPRTAQATGRGGNRPVLVPAATAAGIAALARRSGATLFMVLLAAWKTLLYRYTGESDVAVGSPIANRTRQEVEALIGFFVNTLVLRTDLAGDPLFPELVARVRQVTLGAYAHQDLPFERLVEALAPERDLASTPLFQVMFALQNAPAQGLDLPGLTLAPFPLQAATSAFELTLSLTEVAGGLGGGLEHSSDLFDAVTVDRLAGHFTTLLAAVAERSEQPLSEVVFLAEPERHQIACEWGRARPDSSLDLALHEQIEAQAARAPEATALVWPVPGGLAQLTYAELDARASRLAGKLRDLGVGPDRPVAVFAASSPELVVGMIAIWKAGGVYLPIDPAYPAERVAFLLEDSGARVVLVQEGKEDRLPPVIAEGAAVVRLVDDPDAPPLAPGLRYPPESLAWIIYTSGSTGRPKGVGVAHREAVRHLRTAAEVWGLGPGDRLLQFASPSFDASLEEMVAPLLAGAAVVLRGEAMWEPSRMSAHLAELGVTVVDLPAAFWHLWVREAHAAGMPEGSRLRLVSAGGEAMSPEVARLWFSSSLGRIPLQNGYGPTETVISVSLPDVVAPHPDDLSVPIGRPLPGRTVRVLDRDGREVPAGVPGELSAGGILARGYLGRPDLTAERFVPDPFAEEPGARLYRTGDLVRLLADGRIDFVGRTDHQVKLRGFRVELGEIEAALEGHPAVAAAAVLAREAGPGDLRLVAHVVSVGGRDGREEEPEGLRDFLSTRLPAYMVPAAFAFLPALPLTPNGKVDRKALLGLAVTAPAPTSLAAPRNAFEELVVEVWREVLGTDAVGVHDDFFALGGHSLLATRVLSRLRSVLGVDLPLRALFEQPTAADLAARIQRTLAETAGTSAPPLVPVPRDRELPLSFPQSRLWFLHLLAPDSAAYNMPAALRLRGEVHRGALEAALREVTARHEALRTTFELGPDGEARQRIHPEPLESLPQADLSGLPEEVRSAEARRLAMAEARRPFDLQAGPVLRAMLLRLGEGDHALLVTMHHIVSDGWSIGVLVNEIAALYPAFAAGRPSPLPSLPLQYADFAVWQRDWLRGEAMDTLLGYWRERLAGAPPALALPLDRPRPPVASGRGGVRALHLDEERTASLAALGRKAGATPFMVLLAGWAALLGRLTHETDVPVGTPIANRTRAELESLIGFFVNTLVLRTGLGGRPGFRELIGRVRETSLGAFTHQDMPFERLVEELAPERSLGQTPLFQVLFAFQNGPEGSLDLPELTLEPLESGDPTARFDLSLNFWDEGPELVGSLIFNRDVFDATTAARLVEHLDFFLEAAAAEPDRPFGELPLLPEAARAQLLREWNDTAAALPELSPFDLFARQAERTPEALAVESEEGSWSYHELLERSRAWADRLVEAGVGPEVRVGIRLDRTLERVAVLLGVFAAGGAYVPLDPEYPEDRLAFLVEDSGLSLVIGPAPLLTSPLSQPPPPRGEGPRLPEPENLAAVLYTSGSTGRPKGVMLTRGALVNRLLWSQREYPLAPGDRVFHTASFNFDFALWEHLGPLMAGAAVVLARPGGHRDPGYLSQAIREREITVAHFVPSMLRAFLEEEGAGDCGSLRLVLAGGEALTPELENLFFTRLGRTELRNQYGPTETTIDSTQWLCEPGGAGRAGVPVGRPVDNTAVYPLSPDGLPVPLGAVGELAIGGVGLARGYLGRPDLTAERFLPAPSGLAGSRLYRTGDLGRYRPDGALELVGRADFQVKIRGFRVEPEEVEAALQALSGVSTAAVVVQGEAVGRRLLACVVPAEGESLDTAALREELRRRLPDYMVPAAWAVLAELPLSPNGKVDRQALARLDSQAPASSAATPRTPAEEVVAALWADVLGLDRVGPEDDFFSLGGHSLIATRVVSRVRDAFGIDLPLRTLFEEPTVAGFAAAIERATRSGDLPPAPPIVPVPRTDDLPLSFAQQRLWFLAQLEPESPAYNVPTALRLSGDLDRAVLAASLGEIVSRHEALRTTFEAPANGDPVQRIHPPSPVTIPAIDLAGLPEDRREAEARRLAAEEALRPFDLVHGPLLRCHLLRLAAAEHVALFTIHHIVSDAWSTGVLVRELAALYAAFRKGRPSPLATPPIQYADFAAWQRSWLSGEVLEAQLRYWRERLAGAPPVLELPADRPRPAVSSGLGGIRTSVLLPRLAEPIREWARRAGATEFMALLAAWDLLLRRLTGSADLSVGTPVTNRGRTELEGLLGFFVNTLVLRTEVPAELSFRELTRRVRDGALSAYAHQDLPFERLVEELTPERSLAHSPLFQVMFVLHADSGVGGGVLELPGLTLAPFDAQATTSKFDLTLFLSPLPDLFVARMEYSSDLFDATTVDRWLRTYEVLLAAALAEPDRALGDLPLLAAEERQQLFVEWNDPPSVGELAPVHVWFSRQAARTPERIAVLGNEETTDGAARTYGEVECRSDKLARRLVELGAGTDVPVGVFLGRGWEMGVALLAVLKAGACYLPLDPHYPADRLAFMLADSGAPLVVTQERLVAAMPPFSGQVVTMEEALSPSDLPLPLPPLDALAYIVYTSGSTGKPKGVAVQHRVLSNLIAWQLTDSVLPDGSRTLQFASPSFDASLHEVFATWLAGGTLVIATAEHRRDPEALLDWLRETGVERMFWPYVALQQIAEVALRRPGGPAALGLQLKEMQSSGEQLRITPEIAVFFEALPGCVLHDHYGPSETHVVTAHTLTGPPESWPALPPIGRPLAETALYLLDAQRQPVPIGVPGELFLGGIMVARGYLGRPDLTAERFLPDPYGAPGSRMYRTGDLVRLNAAGEAEFLGRIDHQVKIRGFRVEPGEIEAVLGTHPALREAVIVARGEAATRRLIAYVLTTGDAGPDLPDELGRYLRERMPDYMVPAAFVPLDALPLTPTGKVDRLTLSRSGPEPGARRKAGEDGARTPTEELLAGIWAEVLGVEPGAGDDFFELGGHSLLATRVASRIRTAFGVELPLRTLFEAPKLRALAGRVDALLRQGTDRPLPPLTQADRTAPLPLSFAQERLWFFDQLEPGSAAYNLPSAFRVRGELVPEAFEAALREIVRRHEVLRTHFAVESGRPVQIVGETALSLPRIDLLSLSETARQTELARLAQEEAARPFDLARGPLVRAALVHLDPAEQALLFTMHHVVSDGWSFDVLTREIAALYSAFVQGRPSPLPPLPVQYADYAAWQRSWLSGEVLAAEVAHWKDALAGAPLVLELPADRPRPPIESHRGATLAFAFPADLAAAVRRLARQEGTTQFMTLLAGFGALLSRWTGQRDLLVGSPVAGRTRQEIEPLIGFFVNTLVLRVDLTGEPDFRALLDRVRETALAAYTHQDLPFERLVEELAPERDLSRNPVYQVLFALENAPALSALAADLGDGPLLQPLDVAGETAKNDLTLILHETADGLAGSVSYATDLFDAATIRRLIGHFENLLRGAAAAPGERITRLALMSAAERQQAVHDWNAPLTADPDSAPLYERFERQVARNPDAPALLHAGQPLSYRELAGRARSLGRRLRELGVGPETIVGLCADRSPELLAGMLGIAAAGGAYVPLDPEAPRERLAFVLGETRAPVILTQERWRGRLPECAAHVLVLEEAFDVEPLVPFASGAVPENPAYVIYTSGSTGRPKGVIISQQAVVRLAADPRCLQIRPDDRIGFASTPVFDASTFEIWGALLNGAALVTLDKDTVLSPAALAARLAEDGVTVLFLTTALFQQGAREWPEMFAPLRTVLFGGEACDPRLVFQVAASRPPRRLLHMYGPTETTTFATWHPVQAADAARGTVPIGLPLDDRTVYVLDAAGEPVPAGVAGELFVGGNSVARGYLERPDLTADRFLPDPFGAGEHPGGRLYRTGDLARRRADGAVEFLGRVDFQVKIRGFRIELEEIEAVLRGHPEVAEAVVRLTDGTPPSPDQRLVAYVVPRGGAPTAAELREHLRRTLPEVMVPAGFAFLAALPLNAQGKVDRAVLARTAFEEEVVAADYVAPRTPAEELLAGIWAEALGVERVGAHDNFFDLSGHSLLATRVVHQVREAFGVELPLRSLFERTTLADLAREIEALERGESTALVSLPPIARVPRTDRMLATTYQRLLVLAQGGLVSSMYNMPFGMHLRGPLDVPALFLGYAELLRRHESLRTTLQWRDGDLYQDIAGFESADTTLPLIDLEGLPAEARREVAVGLSLEEQVRPLDVSAAVLRAYLVRLSRDEHVLIVNIHHSMSDGWSLEVLREDLASLYATCARRQPPALPPLPLQYADYAAWTRQAFPGEGFEARLAYWRERLQDRPPGLHLPVPRPRPERVGPRVQVADLVLAAEELAPLRALVRERGTTLPMVLFAAMNLLFHRYTGHEDIVLGSVSSMRDRAELTGLIGLIMNIIPVRTRLAGLATFGELVARVRAEVLGDYSHAVPLPELSAALCPDEPPSRTLFHKMIFNMGSFRASTQKDRPQGDGLEGLEVGRLTTWEGEAKYDLTLQCFDQGNLLLAVFLAPADLIAEEELAALRDDYRELLSQAVREPEVPLAELLPAPRYRPLA